LFYGVINFEKKRDVDAPKSKRKRLKSWDAPEDYAAHDVDEDTPKLNVPTPEI
ncbi:hypothetical protein HAX54_028800, partial [Datura stramonium]|nr:hypothetical protein [Datura stramonium]